jgi:hypothetical protein
MDERKKERTLHALNIIELPINIFEFGNPYGGEYAFNTVETKF